MTVGENIKRIRTEQGLTQKKLGELLGVSQAAIGQFENSDSNLKLETLEKIATALNVSCLELMDSKIHHIEMDIHHYEEQPNKYQTYKNLYEENRLLNNFRKLNSVGQAEALKRMQELTEIVRYTQKE